jgi:hypothetical protein
MFRERIGLIFLLNQDLSNPSIYPSMIESNRIRIFVSPFGSLARNLSMSFDGSLDLNFLGAPVKYSSMPSGSASLSRYANMPSMRLTSASWGFIDSASSIRNNYSPVSNHCQVNWNIYVRDLETLDVEADHRGVRRWVCQPSFHLSIFQQLQHTGWEAEYVSTLDCPVAMDASMNLSWGWKALV